MTEKLAATKKFGKAPHHEVSTTRTFDGNTYRVTYHQTVVFEMTDGIVKLDSGGWYTYTTKKRINDTFQMLGLPYSVHQKNSNWVVSTPDGDIDFVCGMKLDTGR